MKTFYELLGLPATATSDEIKRAFRQEIARYHPDKVQHLGAEFQEMAAARAAQLTEAYRTLMDEGTRAAYDAQLATNGGGGAAVDSPPPPDAVRSEPAAGPARPKDAGPAPDGAPFVQERERRDLFVRRAALDRFSRALEQEFGTYECPQVRGFDVACVSKSRFFARRAVQRVLARYVDRADGPAVTETVKRAARAGALWTAEELSVFLLGGGLAPARELADAIAEHRKRPPRGVKGRIVVVPMDVRDWHALIPQDAPEVARALSARLKEG